MVGSYIAFKMVGAGLIGLSGVKIGSKLKKRLELRRNILSEYKEGIDFIESRISLDELTLEECMKECEKRYCSEFPEFNVFSAFRIRLTQGILSGEEAWNEAVNEVSQHGILSENETSILNSLSSTLGRSDVKHHSKHLQEVSQKIDILICDAEEKLKKDGSLCIKLGLAASAVLILLLW